jgi:hypothetical protein
MSPGIQPSSPESGPDRIPTTWPESVQKGQILAGSSQKIPTRMADRLDPCRLAGICPERLDPCRLVGIWPERLDSSGSGSFRPVSRSPAVLGRISAKTARIRATQILIRLSGLRPLSYNQNPVKVVEILSVSDEISSPVIFILFYINIYMF